MFQTGDLVVYGRTGVCRVEGTVTREGKEFYILRPLYQADCDIYAPARSDKVFIRPIISRQQAEELIDDIPNMEVSVYESRVIRELSEHYQAAIASHDCRELFELTMSLHAKRQAAADKKKKFGAVDERFMKWGEALLFGELAAALDIQPEEVPDYISGRLAGAKG